MPQGAAADHGHGDAGRELEAGCGDDGRDEE